MLWFKICTDVYVSETVLFFVRYYNASYVSFFFCLLTLLTISDKYINKSALSLSKGQCFYENIR